MNRNVVLIGMMGCGKSTIGRILARKLSRGFLDTDREIERRTGQTVNEIFATAGEAAFRDMETAMLADLVATTRPLVVACGGGIVVRPQHLTELKKIGTVVWLSMTPVHLLERLQHSRRQGRPLLATEDWQGVVRRLLAEREASYRQAADIIIACDGLAPGQVVAEIMRNLKPMTGKKSG